MKSELLDYMKELFLSSERKITILESDNNKAALISRMYDIEQESFFATVVYGTGGVVIDNWVRLLASGERDIATWNDTLQIDNYFVVADDILGGLFAMNKQSSVIEYFAPDTLEWESLELYYPHFVKWLLEGDIDLFYSDLRWDNWQSDVEMLSFNDGIAFFPFLWTKSEEERCKRVISINEIVLLSFDMRE